MKYRMLSAGLAIVALSWTGAQVVRAQRAPSAVLQKGEWHDYPGDNFGWKYSPLGQINKDNVRNLRVAWRWKTADREIQLSDPLLRASRYEDTPLMVAGTVYTVTPLNMVAALDPATGQQKWLFDPHSYKEPKPHSNGWATRGLSYWSEGDKGRILLSTTDGYIYAIDTKTGKADPAFGNAGRVDLTEGVPNAIRSVNYIARRPLVAGNVLVAGNFLLDAQPGKETMAVPGWVKAFDAHSGKLLWTFHIVPKKGEFGYDTWLDGSADRQSNANAWGGMTYDPETDQVFFVTSSAGNDYYGVSRPGDNLFADSIVCVEAKTGKRLWHFQAIHHDLWDYDFVTHPALVEVNVKGQRIKGVVGLNKAAMVYLLDRKTGMPIFPTPETPVPIANTANGESSSRTQPMPPPAFRLDHQGSSFEDIIDFTPELKKRALDNLKNLDVGPVYSPPTDKGLFYTPGSLGGANWGGGAFDPETGIYYVPTRMTMSVGRPRYVGGQTPPAQEQHGGAPPPPNLGQLLYIDDLPIVKAPYARVTALDLNKGEKVWVTPIGNGPRNHLALKNLNLPPLGDPILGGSPLVTKTLLFVGITYTFVNGQPQPTPWDKWSDPGFTKKTLYVFDKKTGKILNVFETDNLGAAGPMTYLYNSKQYLLVATGNGPDCELVAYSLP